ncbi:leucine--tRNA ligase, mitochondrial isoform X1 [Drosophila tropicalis]|uniref:leucine--tRNA ligase, mitochondrial isoform X1 n=1 Tax=Drosophila tropicalis TaxID=46794 RepID=UPI0035ABB603
MIGLRRTLTLRGHQWSRCQRLLTQSCTGNKQELELTNEVKQNIEEHWRHKVNEGQFNRQQSQDKYYVLSMFPYPSGNLHMGHVRVYTISDAVARFHRMCGKNVFQPIGWDSFGLPAENAANQRGVEPSQWTDQNISQMKQQLERLGCSFDWSHELSTCSSKYYKWTQKLFLMLHQQGLAYQNEALVNWDPVDQTVLADEQVDANGCSWRSGVKVEKKLLKQWFIRTSSFAKQLLEGLEDPTLRDWRDIINLQRHWIGECDGFAFNLQTSSSRRNLLRVWTPNPEYLKDPLGFLVLSSKHYLAKLPEAEAGHLSVENPFAKTTLPIIFSNEVNFPPKCDVYLAAPSFRQEDRELWEKAGLAFCSSDIHFNSTNWEILRHEVLEAARRLNVGGYRVSSKLQDWLISRQRYWGTPIPIIHCTKCGSVPVPEDQLPVILPPKQSAKDSPVCLCPKCGDPNARRETDTMDTFVDSSWYYLRFLDSHNDKQMFDPALVKQFMPVDLYIGGKEHAVLHLYYARFISHFLHSCGLTPTSEPFSRLLVQGMVMGRSFRIKGSGRYVPESQVEIINAKKNQALLKETKEPVVMSWEKMSKSKLNGVEPSEMFNEYGTDTTRLIILADVAPTSHRNWSSATFPGILNWQKRLWITLKDFQSARNDPSFPEVDTQSEDFLSEDAKLFDARNFYIKGATFNYRHAHQLSVAISKMQGLTNSLRRAPNYIQRYGKQFERALAAQIIMLAPMAPHFASELWSKFVSVKGRLNTSSELQWSEDVLAQHWPDIDPSYNLDLSIKVNGFENCVIKVQRTHLDKVTHSDALDIAFNTESVTSYLIDKKIRTTNFVLYPGIEATLNIYVDKVQKTQKPPPNSSKGSTNKDEAHGERRD